MRREEKQMTKREVAKAVGINENTLRKYENDNRLPYKDEIVDRLAKVLGCSVSYLMESVDPDDNEKGELNPRYEEGKKGKNHDVFTNSGWETVKGVYSDDDQMVEETTLEERADLEKKETVSLLEKEDEQSLRPANLMHEMIQMIARLSALLAGNILTKEEKDLIKASLDMAYREGTEKNTE